MVMFTKVLSFWVRTVWLAIAASGTDLTMRSTSLRLASGSSTEMLRLAFLITMRLRGGSGWSAAAPWKACAWAGAPAGWAAFAAAPAWAGAPTDRLSMLPVLSAVAVAGLACASDGGADGAGASVRPAEPQAAKVSSRGMNARRLTFME